MKFGKLTSRVVSASLIAGFLPFLTGCLTSELWEGDALSSNCQSAPDTKVRLFEKTDRSDFLVTYNETKKSGNDVKPRAYYLMENKSRVEDLKRPHFIRVGAASKLQPVPLRSADAPDLQGSVPATRAEMSADGKGFTVYQNGQKLGAFKLPVYPSVGSQVTKAALTPFTVVVDAPFTLLYILAFYCGLAEGT